MPRLPVRMAITSFAVVNPNAAPTDVNAAFCFSCSLSLLVVDMGAVPLQDNSRASSTAGRNNERHTMTRTFLIDTDTASDDAVALIMALRAPGIHVAAITT